ncbi:MAG TPA: histidine phosphatase family protein [Pelolinea sp.]|nr:histidine phosphatase family protein [Pelolinea sp.]
MVRLYLVRHGTTNAIEQHLMQGASDSPLSARGREEAKLTAESLKNEGIKTAFSSPMGRARETADILCELLDLNYRVIHDLHEIDFGIYEGREYFSVPDENSGVFKRIGLLGRILIAQITGESLSHVSRRARRTWEAITSEIQNGKVMVISHGVFINYLTKYLLPKAEFDKIKPVQTHPCSITELKVPFAGQAEISRLNDISHLKNSSTPD